MTDRPDLCWQCGAPQRPPEHDEPRRRVSWRDVARVAGAVVAIVVVLALIAGLALLIALVPR